MATIPMHVEVDGVAPLPAVSAVLENDDLLRKILPPSPSPPPSFMPSSPAGAGFTSFLTLSSSDDSVTSTRLTSLASMHAVLTHTHFVLMLPQPSKLDSVLRCGSFSCGTNDIYETYCISFA
uniref:Uncharacterized protein n=1 Tax=Leersia perrieri TaxID=77586 RepID=A0A0D9VEZ3_9ORYZ